MQRARPTISRFLAFFTALYMLGCSALALRAGNTEFLLYTVAMVVFIGIAFALHRRVHFTDTALWLLSIWGALHMLGGTVPIPADLADTESATPVLYSLRPTEWMFRYDQLTHAFGFFSATVASWEAARVLLRAKPGPALSAVAALMGVGLGAVNEVIEFGVVLLVPENNVGGYINTGWDLVANSVGAICAGAWLLGRRVPSH